MKAGSTSSLSYAHRMGIVDRWYSRNGVLLLAPVWLVVALTLALPVFNHVGWLIASMGLGAIALGAAIGGIDRSSGSEEYILALPPSRAEQYWIKALLGLVIPVATLCGVLWIKTDVAARFWSLFCSSGWISHQGGNSSGVYVIAALVVPTALFAVCYAGASLGGAPAGLLSSFLVAVTCGGGAMVETLIWGQPRGILLLSATVLVGLGALFGAYPLYLRRDVASKAQRSQVSIAVAIAVVLILLFFLFFSTGLKNSQSDYRQATMTEDAPLIDLSQPEAETGDSE